MSANLQRIIVIFSLFINCHKAVKNMDLGSEIRDPEKTYPGSRGKGGSGSATMLATDLSTYYGTGISCQLHR